MLESYNIVAVTADQVLHQESMGSKRKFWYRNPDDAAGVDWLFKYPRAGSGEHWAEKIAAEVAGLLGISCARVELATFQGTPGSATESFAATGEGLIHGNQLLQQTIRDYDPEKRYRQSYHTLENIRQTLGRVLGKSARAGNPELQFAEYLILDAVIGNTDRHHENWGVLWDSADAIQQGVLAPSFDHASALGREIPDETRARRLKEGSVGAYAERGRGGIYWSEVDQRSPSPLDLVRRACDTYPEVFRPGLAKLARLEESNILGIVNRIPEDWMTDLQRDFTVAMMQYGIRQLVELT